MKEKYQMNSMWRDMDWYGKLRDDLGDLVTRKAMLGGESINEKCKPIGRNLLVKLASYYLKLGTAEAMYRRSAIIKVWHAVGRASEIGLCSFHDAFFDESYESYEIRWENLKTLKEQLMNFVCDSEFFEVDTFHADGCYHLTGGGMKDIKTQHDVAAQWQYPGLQGNSKCARKLWFFVSVVTPTA